MLEHLKIDFEKVTNPFKEDDVEDMYEDSHAGNVGILAFNPERQVDVFLRDYNLHIMYTNFPISEPLAKILNIFPGVETLDIITPYRAKISFGKLFEEEEVQAGIRKSITVYFRTLYSTLTEPLITEGDTSIPEIPPQ